MYGYTKFIKHGLGYQADSGFGLFFTIFLRRRKRRPEGMRCTVMRDEWIRAAATTKGCAQEYKLD